MLHFYGAKIISDTLTTKKKKSLELTRFKVSQSEMHKSTHTEDITLGA
jgi:hypothetical protein